MGGSLTNHAFSSHQTGVKSHSSTRTKFKAHQEHNHKERQWSYIMKPYLPKIIKLVTFVHFWSHLVEQSFSRFLKVPAAGRQSHPSRTLHTQIRWQAHCAVLTKTETCFADLWLEDLENETSRVKWRLFQERFPRFLQTFNRNFR